LVASLLVLLLPVLMSTPSSVLAAGALVLVFARQCLMAMLVATLVLLPMPMLDADTDANDADADADVDCRCPTFAVTGCCCFAAACWRRYVIVAVACLLAACWKSLVVAGGTVVVLTEHDENKNLEEVALIGRQHLGSSGGRQYP
jgi:hypothetical protein